MARLLILLSILVFAVAACYAAEPAGQVYWNKVLPNTPMPSAIKDLLTTDEFNEDKSAAVTVGKGGVSVNTGKGTTVNVGHGGVGVNPGKGPVVNVGHGGVSVNGGKGPTISVGVNTGKGTNVNVGHGSVGVNTGKGTSDNVDKGHVGVNTGKGTSVNVGKGGVGVNTGKGDKGVSVNVGHGGVSVNTGKGKPGGTRVNVGKGGHVASPFNYIYAATETQVHDDPNVALFFLEKDLQPGTKMTLHFTPTTSSAAFVSRQEANSVPFTLAKLPQILNHFSVDSNSAEAEAMKNTLSECEEPAMTGESKYCATSLESMVEFSTLSLGTRKVAAVSTTADKENSPRQQYTILSSGVKKLSGSNLVVCHAQNYAYAVFYCHTTRSTRAYEVSMAGEDGTKVEAVAVCHADTAGWNPKHIAFQVLGVKPGSVPVCHFLPQDHVVWSPKN